MAKSVSEASIKLKVDADKVKPGLEKANREMEKFKKDQVKNLGDIAQAGEKISGAFARAGGMSSAFERLASGADNFRASVDVAAQSVGNLVNSINLAKATGQSLMSGLVTGGVGIGIGALMGILTSAMESRPEPRPEGAPVPLSPEALALRSIADVDRRVADLSAARRRETMERRMRESATPTGVAEHRDIRRRSEIAELRGSILSDPIAGAASREERDRMWREVERLERELAEDEARALRVLREEHRRSFDDRERTRRFDRATEIRGRDFETGRGAAESLRTPREMARAELRRLVEAEERTPGSVGADVIRRRADVLASAGAESPIGSAAIEAGSVAAARAATELAVSGRDDADRRGEALLMEVRDEIIAERRALGEIHTTITALAGGAGDLIRRGLGLP